MHTILHTQYAHTQYTDTTNIYAAHTPQQYRTQIQQYAAHTEQNNTGATQRTEQRTTHNLNAQPQRTEHSTDNLYTYSFDFYHEYVAIKNSDTIEFYTIFQD